MGLILDLVTKNEFQLCPRKPEIEGIWVTQHRAKSFFIHREIISEPAPLLLWSCRNCPQLRDLRMTLHVGRFWWRRTCCWWSSRRRWKKTSSEKPTKWESMIPKTHVNCFLAAIYIWLIRMAVTMGHDHFLDPKLWQTLIMVSLTLGYDAT